MWVKHSQLIILPIIILLAQGLQLIAGAIYISISVMNFGLENGMK